MLSFNNRYRVGVNVDSDKGLKIGALLALKMVMHFDLMLEICLNSMMEICLDLKTGT